MSTTTTTPSPESELPQLPQLKQELSALHARARSFNESLKQELAMGPLTEFVLAARAVEVARYHAEIENIDAETEKIAIVRNQLHNLKALMLQKWKECAQLQGDFVELNIELNRCEIPRYDEELMELEEEVTCVRVRLMVMDGEIVQAERYVA